MYCALCPYLQSCVRIGLVRRSDVTVQYTLVVSIFFWSRSAVQNIYFQEQLKLIHSSRVPILSM